MIEPSFPRRRRPPARILFLVALSLLILGAGSATALAQFERYELGRRLREFELEWDRRDDAEARAAASRSLKTAVNSFFSLRMGDAGRAVSEARFALRIGRGPSDAERWAESLCVKPGARFLDASTPELHASLVAFYPDAGKRPEGARLRLSLGSSAEAKVEVPLAALPLPVSIPLKGLGEGDHTLVAEVVAGGETIGRSRQTISLAERLDARLAALSATVAAWPRGAGGSTLDRDSARAQLDFLKSLAAKATPESDFPAARMLRDLEEQIKAADAGRPFLGKDRTGQAWIAVATKSGRSVAARILVPDAAARGTPLPLVVALHGAGGSENMFFETYGHGAIVDRCKERGWLLVAPRSGGFGGTPVAEMVDELAKLYPIDTKRVMLVGHSMGAAQAIGAAQVAPDRYAAVAALGGGGSVRPVPGLKDVPFFVGVGSEDFALRGARGLAASLERAGVTAVTFREYPSVEHLTIVQVALGDVFRFFDARAK